MTDYDLPAHWQAMSDAQKAEWFTEERVRRQMLAQDMAAARILRKQYRRHARKLRAHRDTVDIER